MTSMRKFEIKNGRVEGLSVAGFHGQIDPAYTPARRGAIFIDSEQRLAIPVEDSSDGNGVVEVSEIVVEDQESLEGAWTPTRHYAAQVGGLFLMLGPDERFRIEKVRLLSGRDKSETVSAFLHWMASDTPISSVVSAERQRATVGEGDISIWYCTPSDAEEVVGRCGVVYTGELLQVVRDGDATVIEKAAFRLWRAATSVDDIYLVAAALQKIGYRKRRWEELLREGVKEATPDERLAGVERAARVLDRRADSDPPTSGIYPRRTGLRARYLVQPAAAALRAEAA